MIYQVRANIYLQNEGAARGLYQHLAGIFPEATLINPDSSIIEFTSIDLIMNHHDESPTSPCQIISHLDNSPPPP